jgi:uncharacterized membrane protein
MLQIQTNLQPILLGVIGANELLITALPPIIIIIIGFILISKQKNDSSGRYATKAGIIFLIIGIALFLIAQTMNPYVYQSKNILRIIVNYNGMLMIVFGGILLAIGLTKKKTILIQGKKRIVQSLQRKLQLLQIAILN